MTPTERKEQARAKLIMDIHAYAETHGLVRKEHSERVNAHKLLADTIDAYAAACVAEALAKTVKLGDCQGFVEAVNEACICGGGGPGDCCPACEVFHAIKGMEIVKR